jgi:flagellar biosynthetic protein FliQ
MNADAAVDIFKTLITFSLMLMAPFLGIILVVGLLTSLLQSITSIQEQTLTFVPKLVACAGLLLLLAPWMLRMLGEFTVQSFMRMSTMGP